MSLSMTVEFGGATRTFQIDLAELEALYAEAEREPVLRTAVGTVFDSEHDGDRKLVRRNELIEAIEILKKEGQSGLKAIIYSVYASPMPGVPKSSCSSISGAKVGDEFFTIIGGVNECTVERYHQNEKNDWQLASKEDIRHVSSIHTDNMGEIEIRKRSRPNNLLKLLKQLQQMLTRPSSSTEVYITIG